MKEKTIILNLGDEDVNQNFLIKTTKTEKQVAKKVAFIISRFEDESNEEWFDEEWTFDGVIEELVDAGFIKYIKTDEDWEIYA